MCCFRLKHSTKPLQLIVVGRKQSIGPTLPVSTWQHRLGFHALPSLQVSLFRSRNYCSVQAQVCTIEKYQPNSHRNLVFLCCSIASVLACRSLKPGTRLRTHLLLSTHTSRTVPQKTDRQTDRQTDKSSASLHHISLKFVCLCQYVLSETAASLVSSRLVLCACSRLFIIPLFIHTYSLYLLLVPTSYYLQYFTRWHLHLTSHPFFI